MSEGLLFVFAEPGRAGDAEFHDWYDNEHAPARLSVPGIRSGYRYRALDGQRPGWLAWYELDLAALESPEYEAVRVRSPRERSVVERLDVLDRRVYEQIDDRGEVTVAPPVVVSVALSTRDPDGLDAWYREEHVPLLHAMPGWRRTRRYRRTGGSGPDLLAFHEIDSVDLFAQPLYREATSTARRERVMREVTARERRVFGYHNTVRVS
ncbi:hypothetical protein HFP15_18455 [Amycolatopsis sp. K13G38]|uniref:EthD family reductase n=1 Tax=Amycolatopsis acididurans TaxID=2724524 RepID=A0ABX1J4X5_9PSEU|nr:hypothetical protein [Amycolatopsis acididurans]NKQ54870.1 hypothetical protein [Amycolatopsis acididurans]